MRNHAPAMWIPALLLAPWIGCSGGDPQGDPVQEDRAAAPAEATWAGSEACASCHAEHGSWQRSHHAKAWSPAGAFPEALASGPVIDGEDRHEDVVGWVGWEPLRQPLLARRGRVQAAPVAWDPVKREWFEVFDDGRVAGDRGHWTGPAMTWNTQCAPCHTTGLRPGYAAGNDRFQTEVAEQGVGCEACHGPGSLHVAGEGTPALGSPTTDGCGACHARRADLDPTGPLPERFLDRFAPELVGLSESFWADGRVREEDFEYNAFLTSRMHDKDVGCVDCHDPHSGKPVRDGDALCLECHATHEGWVAHDHHDGAVGCVDCHMPVTTYMQRHPRHDHRFAIPDPELAAELGAPDPCTAACHDGRDPAWSAAALARWEVDPTARPQRKRAWSVQAARGGGPEGWKGAVALLERDPSSVWRAVGAGVLGPWAGVPEVRAVLLKAVDDPEPLVRFAAIGSLGGPPSSTLDPVLAVRVQAARSAMGARAVGDPSMADLARYLSAHRDQPEPALEWGSWQLAHGRPEGLAELRRAWELWPADPVVAHGFAVALAGAGQGAEAVRVLEDAVGRRAEESLLWDALGRARAGGGDVAGGVKALERAVALDPGLARTWYNLGVLRAGAGDLDEALAAYRAAAEADPLDPDPCWAAATLELGRNHREEARTWNVRALARNPGHPGARDLEARLR